MDPNWVAAIASLGSAVVVVFAAIASFRQITHFRNANDIVVYTRLTDRLDQPETIEAIRIAREIGGRLRDPAFREALRKPGSVDPEYDQVGYLLRFLEHIATLVITGGVAEQLILAEYADNIEAVWENLREVVYLRRDAFGPYTGAAFEHLAMRAKHYRESGAMDRLYGSLQRDPRGGEVVAP